MFAMLSTAADAMACEADVPVGLDVLAPNDGAHDPVRIDQAIGHFTNEARCLNGLTALSPDTALREAAIIQADNMVALDQFSHDTSAPGAETMQQRLAMAGVTYRRAAENIITGFFMQYVARSSYYTEDKALCLFVDYDSGRPLQRHTYATLGKALVMRWMDSPGHKANILTPEIARHGAAMAPSVDKSLCGGLMAVQVFAG